MKSIITADELSQVLEILGLPGETLSFEVGPRFEPMSGHASSWRLKAVIHEGADVTGGCVALEYDRPYQTLTVYVPVLLPHDKTPEQVTIESAERKLQLAEGAIQPGQATLKVDVDDFVGDVTAAAASYRAANKFDDDVEVTVNPPAWVRRQLTGEVIAALAHVNVKLDEVMCSGCLAGEIEHLTNPTQVCWLTHMPYKNCGVECCLPADDAKLLSDDRGSEYLGY